MNTWSDLNSTLVTDALASLEKFRAINASLLQNIISAQSNLLLECQALSAGKQEKMWAIKCFPEFFAVQNAILLQCSESSVENYKNILSIIGNSRDAYLSMADESLKSVGDVGGNIVKKSPQPNVAAKSANRKSTRKAAQLKEDPTCEKIK